MSNIPAFRRRLLMLGATIACVGAFAGDAQAPPQIPDQEQAPTQQQQPQQPSSQGSDGYVAGIRMISPLPGDEWRLPNGDAANTRFSPLAQITLENAAKLHVVTTMTTGIPHGHEGNPLVVNGTMYEVPPYPNDLIAIDLTKPNGPLQWQ